MRYLSMIFLILILGFGHNTANGQALSGGFYDHTVPLITYSGVVWATVTDSLNFGGSRTTSGQVTSTLPRFDFTVFGDGFSLYILQNSVGATADLCVNDICQSISYYSASNNYAVITITGLGYGTHNIYVQKTSITNTAINLDAIYVFPPAPAPTSIPVINITMVYPTPQPTPTGTQFVWVGNFPEVTEDASVHRLEIAGRETTITYDINPLEVVIVVMLGFILIVMGAGFVVKIWGAK